MKFTVISHSPTGKQRNNEIPLVWKGNPLIRFDSQIFLNTAMSGVDAPTMWEILDSPL